MNAPSLVDNSTTAIGAALRGMSRRIAEVSSVVPVFVPAAGGAVVFNHNLGKKPDRIVSFEPDVQLTSPFWITTNDRKLWNATQAAFTVEATASGFNVNVSVGVL